MNHKDDLLLFPALWGSIFMASETFTLSCNKSVFLWKGFVVTVETTCNQFHQCVLEDRLTSKIVMFLCLSGVAFLSSWKRGPSIVLECASEWYSKVTVGTTLSQWCDFHWNSQNHFPLPYMALKTADKQHQLLFPVPMEVAFVSSRTLLLWENGIYVCAIWE